MRLIVGAILLCWAAGAQPNWVQLSPSTVPPAREAGVMAYDGARRQIVMFGGAVVNGTGFTDGNDTWLWDGQNWNATSPSSKPAARDRSCMIYDPRIQKVVMFGGTFLQDYADTWLWDGTNWTLQATPGVTPPAGICYQMFGYDEVRQQAILITPVQTSSTITSQTWSWDGTAWTQLHPAHVPPVQGGGEQMAFDRARGELLLAAYGDNPTSNAVSTWAWNGTDWIRKPASGDLLPYNRNPGQAVYDAVHQQVLIFLQHQQTWAWNGTTWTLLHPANSPSDRILMQAAFDEVSQRVVAFGGGINVAPFLGNDTWVYTDPQQPVQITVPPGVQFTFNGVTYTGSQTIQIAAGTYPLSTTTPQPTGAGTQMVFTNWSDGGAISHSVTVPVGGVNLTGTFVTQYLLSTVANPNSGGTVSGGGYYNAGTTASPAATPNGGFLFANWSGACSGSGACSVTMNSPATVTANFNAALIQFTVNVPAAAQFTFNGTTYTGTQTISAPPGSYTLSTTTPQTTAAGTQLAFVSWSDGGAISHNVSLSGVSGSITGTFKTQYLLTTSAVPVGAGAVLPASAYFDSGTTVNVGTAANAGFQFAFWGGACSGSASLCHVLMNAPLTVVGNFTATPKWIQMGPATSPPARYLTSSAFDGGRNEVVVFGGISANGSSLADTWTWNGTNWTFRSSAGPSARSQSSMAYDPSHGQMLLFGGQVGAAATNETWLWDGTAGVWTKQNPSTLPSPRYLASLAWDGARLILFGGFDGFAYLNDTWAWSGSNWVQLAPATAPSVRYAAAMTFDAARNQVVLFGGLGNGTYLNDTWVWTGSNWAAKSPGTSPSVRSAAMLVYDPVIQQSVLFGGFKLGVSFPAEVWLWDGANWRSAPENPSPSDRSGVGAAYDAARQQVVLFGGADPTADNDTWIFANNAVQQFYTLTTAANPVGSGTIAAASPGQAGPSYRAGSTVTLTASSTPAAPFGYWSGACSGSTCLVRMTSNQTVVANYPPPPKWVQLSPATMLSGRTMASLAFDPGRGETVLFGGLQEATGTYLDETWTWDGTTWTQQHPASHPFQRYGHAMAYDPLNRQMILYGGQIHGTFSSETWLWDGAAHNWTLIPTAHAPVAGFGASLAWDGSHLILFGGQATNGVVQNDTWAWTGSDWALLSPMSRPPARQLAAMTYDAVRNQVLLFGGETSNLNGLLGDTWVWDGTNWTQRILATSPAARSRAVIAYHGAIQKVVLFSGLTVAGTADTWLWDGNAWTQRAEDPSPFFQFGSAMAYDSARQQIVLLAHYAGDGRETWLYANNAVQQFFSVTTTVNPAGSGNVAVTAFGQAGPLFRAGSSVDVRATPTGSNEFQGYTGGCAGSFTHCILTMTGNQTVGANFGLPLSWLQLNPATSAAPKANLALQNPVSTAFDAARQQVVYFGGPLGDQTWTWNGTTWTKRAPAHSPPARSGHAMAYDAARQRVILFGGGNGVAFNDTWSWDGTDWTLVDPGTGPGKRFNHGMAYDRVRQEIVMLGGLDENFNFYSDTWAWNGSQWILRALFTGPPPRSDFGIAFDPVNAEVLISSGYEGQNDTWGWNGSVWTKKLPAHQPPSTANHFSQMTYDERLQRIVLLIDASPLAPATWVWNGFDWIQLNPTQSPTPRAAGGIVYDGVRGQVLLFSGDGAGGPLNDTWVLSPPAASLTLQSVSAVKNAAGNYLVTFVLKNTGNTPASAVFGFSATAVNLVSGVTTTTNTFPLGQFSNIAPGASGTFQAQFPAAAGSGTHSFSAQGSYSTVAGATGNWTLAVRSVVFP